MRATSLFLGRSPCLSTRLALVRAAFAILLTAAITSLSQAVTAPPLRGNLGIHDPSTIIKCKDRYYLFGSAPGIISKWSTDKVFWTAGPKVFANAPAWTTDAVPAFDGNIWAPDVFFLNGRYCLYYAISSWGSQISAIGLATNPTLDPADAAYQWTDQGIVIQSTTGNPYNTIDPSVVRDASGNPWMSFGSYWSGIYVVQLDPLTGLRIAPNSPVTRLACNSSIEASCLYRRGGYYYLFVNWGSCCAGVNSTYNIRVGRGTSVTGPYLDRNGVDMVNNGGTLFLEGTGKFTGPGHMGVLAEDGTEWFSYHYYDAGAYAPWYNAYGQADFDLEPLSWTADGWPVFTNDWSAVYEFQADAREENGQYYGLLQGGASITNDPVRGRVLNLSGTNQYVQLPPGVAYARTFAAVVKWNGGGSWQRIFDFGTDTSRYVMLTPSSGTGKLTCHIKAGGGVQSLEAPYAMPVGVWTHAALTLDGQRGVLYVNSAAVATNSSMTISPLDVLAQTNHLGHSKFVADPDFKGQIASFRAYGRVLSPAEIAAPLPLIAQPADGSPYWPGQTISFSGSATDFSGLPLGAGALNWRVEHVQDGRTNLVLGPLTGLTGGTFAVPTNATDGRAYRIILTATDGASRQRTVAASLSPANPPPSPSSYYPLRADARDANGHYDGALNGGASFTNDPTRGSVLNLSGSAQFASFPPGAAGFQTLMAWVKWNGGGNWQRVFDFGNDTTTYSALTPSAANGKLRFNITVNGIGGEQVIDGPGALPVGVWTHVAVTLDGNAGVLYTNGVPVATNSNVNLLPAYLSATNNYFGKSQWPDPYFNGQLSAVRMFARALSAAEIVAPQPVIAQPAHGTIYRPADIIRFAGSASDFYAAPLSAAALTWTVRFIDAGVTNTVFGPFSGLTNASFNIPDSGAPATNGFYRVLLSATDTSGRKATNFVDIFPAASIAPASDWGAFYPFTTGAQDASNNFDGTLSGGASIQTDATRGKGLNLSGSSQYVQLPAGVGPMKTFSGWVKWNGGNPWQRIFDFGQDTEHWLMLTPLDSDSKLQCAITPARSTYVQVIQAPVALPTSVWTHIAVALDGRQGILYVNGQAVAINNSVNLFPSDVAATKCYLGKSQYSGDAYFGGQFDSVRLNSRALALEEILAPTPAILQPLPTTLFAGGDSLAFNGSGTDYRDAALPASAFTWTAEYFHEGLRDIVLGPLTGVTNGTLAITTNGPVCTNISYRLTLLVTDANGLKRAVSTDLQPRVSQMNLATVPAGLELSLDGQPLAAPASLPLVAGMKRTLAAPSPQTLGSTHYSFVLWSDGGAATHDITVPTNAATYTGAFVQPAIDWSSAGGSLQLRWPCWAGSLQLCCATSLVPPVAWSVVTIVSACSNGLRTVSASIEPGNRFYRLKSP
jgi:arabinan endo-1,5-alpha-L-arabinosidase